MKNFTEKIKTAIILRVALLVLVHISFFLSNTHGQKNSLYFIGSEPSPRPSSSQIPVSVNDAVLIIEPHGAYTEQSLYITYSDPAYSIHYLIYNMYHWFTLPEGSVINDMWLWTGDKVMRTLCVDTWKSKNEGINENVRGPAVLQKNDAQYLLRLDPFSKDQSKKLKINFISPTQWIGQTAVTELPVNLLQQTYNKCGLRILYRSKDDVWGTPGIYEDSSIVFSGVIDTMGYRYRFAEIPDVKKYSMLRFIYKLKTQDGLFHETQNAGDSLVYFQSGFMLKDVFGVPTDTAAKKVMIAVDLSSKYNKHYDTLIPKLKRITKAVLKGNDLFNVVISGADKIKKMSTVWLPAKDAIIDDLYDKYVSSRFADSIARIKIPVALFMGATAAFWEYPGIRGDASLKYINDVFLSMQLLKDFDVDIILGTDPGENRPAPEQYEEIYTKLDAFFDRRFGRLFSYYTSAQMARDPIPPHYIKGLVTDSKYDTLATLYSNKAGNIGSDLPDSLDLYKINYLKYDDPEVKVELMDRYGNAAVISKRIGNGLVVVSGINPKDQVPNITTRILLTSLYGTRPHPVNGMIKEALQYIKTEYQQQHFDQALIISTSDTLFNRQETELWSWFYSDSYRDDKPVINTINLLDNSRFEMPRTIVDDVEYLGSGYLLKTVSSQMKGYHIESYTDPDIYSSVLTPSELPEFSKFNMEVLADGVAENVTKIKQISTVKHKDSPLLFAGSAKPCSTLKFKLTAGLKKTGEEKTAEFIVSVNKDTSRNDNVLPAILASEEIKDLMTPPIADPGIIAKKATQFNLLSNYTALLAVYPTSTIGYMENPFDESHIRPVQKIQSKEDSLGIDIYPNPFNSQTKIRVIAPSPSVVSIHIYNVLGQVVATISQREFLEGTRMFEWNGKDNFGQYVSSGVYFTRVEIAEQSSSKKSVYNKKMMLVK